MFVEVVKSKQGNRVYKSVLVRESYRQNGKVKHRTIANISKFSEAHIKQIRDMLRSDGGKFKIADLQSGVSYEYGGSFALLSLAKQIGLGRMICSTKEPWREDILAMIVGRILYQGSKLSLVNTFRDTALWELVGHTYGVRPDVDANCYRPMDKLLDRKARIEKKLAKKHLSNGCIVLYDITNIWFEGEYSDSEIVAYGRPKGGKYGYKQVALGLLTNNEGCPVSVEIFKGNTSDQTTVLAQVKKISVKYGIDEVIFTGDRGMLTQNRIDEIQETDFKIITALTHLELKSLIKRENISIDMFDERRITEVVDSDGGSMHYMLCKNEQEKQKERTTRNQLIEKVESLLTTKAAVKTRRSQQKVCASIGRIFEKYRIEKFFTWNVDKAGKLTWKKKESFIQQEAALDGCYVIKTDADPKTISKDQVVESYRNLQKVEQAFRNFKTVMLELRPVYHKSDKRIESHIFLVMLSYYLQWHMTQRLKPLFEADGVGKDRRWTVEGIIDRLKSISKVNNLIDGVLVKTTVSKPDPEQQEILDYLEVKMM